jgi:glycosyltransferase involved in cell wall biosynthesis
MNCSVAVIMSGFPRRSETFALGELLALEERGMLAGIFATKPGDEEVAQPEVERLIRKAHYLRPGPPDQQGREVAARLHGLQLNGVHGYFAHAPAEVALHAAAQLGIPYGFSMHARDARKVSRQVLAGRAHLAACVVACNQDVATEMQRDSTRVHLVPHGVHLVRFQPNQEIPGNVLRLLAVGRLVEKKGFDILIEAVASLRLPFHLRIVGEGPERERLEALICARGLAGQVTLCGAKSHEELPAEYAAAHVVVVPSVVDRSGDRDGLPNVVLEAMACGRPVVATGAGAITSVVIQGDNGMLVPERDPQALCAVLDLLGRAPDLRHQLGRQGRQTVERNYELNHCTGRFCDLLTEAYA